MGKLGIILAFLLSVAAAGGSYYLYQGYVEARSVQESVQAKYDQVKFEKDQIRAEKEQVSAEKEQITAKSEAYRAKAETMQTKVGQLQTEQARIDSEKVALEEKLKGHQSMIAELKTKMLELEKKAKEAQAACGVSPADLKGNPLSDASSGAGSSQVSFKPVTSNARADSMTPVAAGGTTASTGASTVAAVTTSPAAETSATDLTATGPRVLTVNRKFNFVVINQGLQEGFKMGDRLKVLKKGQEIATIQIEKLYDKFSAATLVEEDPKQQVVEGDEIRKI